MIEMKPSESLLPRGVKPLSTYAHGTNYVSNEKRISRRTARPKSHYMKLEHNLNKEEKLDVSTNNMGERQQLKLQADQLGENGQFAHLLK